MGRDYQNRGRGRGGREVRSGQDKGKPCGDKPKGTTGTKTPNMKFFLHGISCEKQSATYNMVKDHIIQTIGKTFKHAHDTVILLRDLKIMDLQSQTPKREISVDLEAEVKRPSKPAWI